MHYGVRITDAAIVAAATLSDRYISDRFLPDKVTWTRPPPGSRLNWTPCLREIDQIEHETMQLENGAAGAAKEEDATASLSGKRSP